MPEPWGAGPGLSQRFVRSSAQAGASQQAKKARKNKAREAQKQAQAERWNALSPRQRQVRAIAGAVVLAVIVASVIWSVVTHNGADHTTKMQNLALNVEYRADLALKKDGYADTIKSTVCEPSGTRQARCHLTASNGTQTTVTAYISANGKTFVTGP